MIVIDKVFTKHLNPNRLDLLQGENEKSRLYSLNRKNSHTMVNEFSNSSASDYTSKMELWKS